MLGYLPDPEKLTGETPDFDAAELLGSTPVPGAASARHLVWDVLSQGALNSCVANAGFQAIRASHVRQGVNFPRLGSRLFGWYMARATHFSAQANSGTYIRAFFSCLNKFGFPIEDAWPYDANTAYGAPFMKMPPTRAFQLAVDQRSPTVYRRIYDAGYRRVEAVKRAVAAGHLVCFGTDVSEQFVSSPGVLPLEPPIGQPIAGGHAMCVAGYDGDNFDVVNSWGPRWGSGGWCVFSADYIAWSSTRDLWIVEHAPKYSDTPTA